MKKILISMLAMVAMVSCSSESDLIDEVNPVDTKVKIELGAGVGEIKTKAAIEGAQPTFIAKVIRANAVDDQNLTWGTTAIQADVTSGKITFNPVQYYEASNNAYFIGYSASGAGELTTGKVTYTIDGDIDVMSTAVTSVGSKISSVSNASLTYLHKLTYIKVLVQAEDQESADYWGNLTSVKIKGVNTVLDLDLKSGILTDNSNPSPTNLECKGKVITGAIPLKTAEESAKLAGYLMVPVLTNPTILIKTANFPEKEVAVALTTTASTKNTITLTLKRTTIDSISATTGNWGDGNSKEENVL